MIGRFNFILIAITRIISITGIPITKIRVRIRYSFDFPTASKTNTRKRKPKNSLPALPRKIFAGLKFRNRNGSSANIAEADKIRKELLEKGIELFDTPDGVKWKKIGK